MTLNRVRKILARQDLPEDLKSEFHKIDFIIKNPVSPVSLLESPDGRSLGILVESIKII